MTGYTVLFQEETNMIKFLCRNIDTDELNDLIIEETIQCTAQAIGPLYGDYEKTGLDYSFCKSIEEKRYVFAKNYLGEIDTEITNEGVILHDDFSVEAAECFGIFNIKKLIKNVKKVYPKLEAFGAGQIDYHSSITQYKIYTERDGEIHVKFDGKEYLDEGEALAKKEETKKVINHYSDKLPRLVCDGSNALDGLLNYRKEIGDSIVFNKDLSFALELPEAQISLIYMPICEDSIEETQKVGFPLDKNAKGVLFVYQSNKNYTTTTNNLMAICAVFNGSDNQWACPNPALLNSLATYYEICVSINLYLQDKGLYEQYKTLKEYAIIVFKMNDGKLIAKKIVC